MRLAWLLLVGTMPVVAVGCGGSSSSGEPTPRTSAARAGAAAPAASLEVTEREWSISLAGPAPASGRVVLHVRNEGRLTHALAIEGPGVHVRSGSIPPGGAGTLSATLAKGGSYTVFCPIDGHRGKGMQARLAAGGGAATPTQTSPAQMSTTSGGGGY